MLKLYVLSFLAGLVAIYGVPLFIKGVSGERHEAPVLGKLSAAVGVILGWVDFVVAALLLHFAHPWDHLYRASGLFAIAALLMAVALAQMSSTRAMVTKR